MAGALKNINELYDKAVREGSERAEQFWGTIPKDFASIADLCDDSDTPRDVDTLVSYLREFHKEKGIYSQKVEDHLLSLKNGSILGGQQPIVFGGSGFIANKIACLTFTHEILAEQGKDYSPIFMIGSDGLQKELIRAYFPNPISPNATLLDLQTDQLPDTSAERIKLPNLDWFKEIVKDIEESFRGFRKKVKGAQQKLVKERFDHIVTLLTMVFNQSDSFNDMFVRIWGTIANVINDIGIIFLPVSDNRIKKYYVEPYLKFLDSIETYTETFERQTEKINKLEYHSSLPNRSLKYSPFYLICDCDIRVNPDIKIVEGKRIAHGHCQHCNKIMNFPVGTADEIMKIEHRLAPRVDTSQLVLQDLLNVKVRISGPGEIAYYAQVAPSIRAIGFRTPIFVKYKRLFYNSPWNEKLGKQLESRNQGSIHGSKIFDQLKKRLHALREGSAEGVREAEITIATTIIEEYNLLLKRASKHEPSIYLSWQFGRFTPEKFGQEVSWIWIDMALQTGLNDYIQTYRRMYTPYSVPGLPYFTNTNL